MPGSLNGGQGPGAEGLNGGRGPGAGGRGAVLDCGPNGSEVSHFRDLVVWQRGMELVVAVYRVSSGFPKGEIYGLTSQIRRAAVSIPSNIAEGHTRASTKEYLNHISMAQSSLAEVETQLELAGRLEYGECTELQPVLDHCAVLGRQLYKLRDSLRRRL